MRSTRSSMFALVLVLAALAGSLPGDGRACLDRARILLAAGNEVAAFPLLASVASSGRSTDPRADAATLMRPLAEKQWEARVAPEQKAGRSLRAIAAAKPIAAAFSADDELHIRLEQLKKSATEHHQAAASRSGPRIAALHLALAHRIDPSVAKMPVGSRTPASAPVSLELSALPADCSWLVKTLARSFGGDTASGATPVHFEVSCSHEVVLEPETSFTSTTTEPAYRKEMGMVAGPVEIVKEEYKCIQPKRVQKANLNWETIQVWTTCTREVERATRIPGEVMVS